MKKIFLILSLFIGLVSCQDKDLGINPTDVKVAQTQEAAEGMQRIVVNSRSEIKALINRMGNKTKKVKNFYTRIFISTFRIENKNTWLCPKYSIY